MHELWHFSARFWSLPGGFNVLPMGIMTYPIRRPEPLPPSRGVSPSSRCGGVSSGKNWCIFQFMESNFFLWLFHLIFEILALYISIFWKASTPQKCQPRSPSSSSYTWWWWTWGRSRPDLFHDRYPRHRMHILFIPSSKLTFTILIGESTVNLLYIYGTFSTVTLVCWRVHPPSSLT